MTAADRQIQIRNLKGSCSLWSYALRIAGRDSPDRQRIRDVLRTLKRLRYELTVGVGR